MSRLQTLTCPNCGSPEIDPGLLCSACDSQLSWNSGVTGLLVAGLAAHCPKCRHANPAEHRFCAACGERLGLECLACDQEHPLGTLVCPATGISYRELHEVASKRSELLEEARRARGAAAPERALLERRARLARELEELAASDVGPSAVPLGGERARQGAMYGVLGGMAVVLPLVSGLNKASRDRPVYEFPLFENLGIGLAVFGLIVATCWALGVLRDRQRNLERLRERRKEIAARREQLTTELGTLPRPDLDLVARADRAQADADEWLRRLAGGYARRGVRLDRALARLASG